MTMDLFGRLKYNDDYKSKIEWFDFGEKSYPFAEIDSESGLLLNRRKQLGLTQSDVAKKAGITVRQYQRLESGERRLSTSTFRIAMGVINALRLDPQRFADRIKE